MKNTKNLSSPGTLGAFCVTLSVCSDCTLTTFLALHNFWDQGLTDSMVFQILVSLWGEGEEPEEKLEEEE